MKKAIALIVGASLLFTLAGCSGEVESPSYDEEIFVCDPDNIFGLEGIYADEDDLVINFDEDFISDEPYTSGIENIFDREELFANDSVYIRTDGDSIVIDEDDITVDGDDYVIRIENHSDDKDEMTGIELYIGGTEYTIDIDEETLSVLMWGGECSDTFTQVYNSRNDSWSDVDHEQQVYPMTYETGAQPDVEPDIEPVYSEGGMIVPFLAEYIEDEYMPEYNEYLYGFTDFEGNVVYDPQFDSVQFVETMNVYIVRSTEGETSKFGILSADGSMITDLIYDGAHYEQGMDESDPEGQINLTLYEAGVLHTSIFKNGNLEVSDDIVIDEDALPYDAATSNLTLCHMSYGGAIVQNESEFYPHRVLIDVTNGEILRDFDSAFGDEILFGDMVIETEIHGDVTVYDMTGECVFDEHDATGFRLTPYRFLITFDGELQIVDMEGVVRASMDIGSNAFVDSGAGLIVVCENGNTTIYDEDLNEITEAGVYDIDYGYCPGRWDEDPNGEFFFVSFESDVITNLMTGDSMPVEEGYYYSYEGGYVFANNRSDGNTDDHRWRVYDSSLNLIREEEGYADICEDRVTGEEYIIGYNDGLTTVYSLDTCDTVFEMEGDYGLYLAKIYDGVFGLTDMSEYLFADMNGEVFFSCEITP